MYKPDEEKIRTDNIFKNIKYHMNELKRLRPDYEILMIALQGSQNYNLDLHNDEYNSDVDTIAIVLPSFDSLIDEDKKISETIILDNNEHIDVKDIRNIFELFRKQNIKYLEILFTKYRIINKDYREIINKLIDNNESLAHYDTDRLIRTTSGMAQEKLKAMEHRYEGLKEKIDKYGYDGKQLHHIIRLAHFLSVYGHSNSFKQALDSNNYILPSIEVLTQAKLNKYSLEGARSLANFYIKEITNLRQEFEGALESNKSAAKILDEIQAEIFRTYFTKLFTPEPEKVEKKELFTPALSKIYVTSDLHFGHENILNFEEKRWELCGISQSNAISNYVIENNLEVPKEKDKWDELKSKVNKKYINKHDEELIRRWNSKISNKDYIYILGDFSFYNGKITNEILKRLNGKKILVKGNHDHQLLKDKNFDPSLFEEIVDYKEIRSEGYVFILFHFPIQVWNLSHKKSIHLYGHVHSNTTTLHVMKHEMENSYNVGVDVNDYYPVPITNYTNRVIK